MTLRPESAETGRARAIPTVMAGANDFVVRQMVRFIL
jgi:hypothetical protein